MSDPSTTGPGVSTSPPGPPAWVCYVLNGLVAFGALLGCFGWAFVTFFFTLLARPEDRAEASSTIALLTMLPVILALGGAIAGIVLARRKRPWASLICGGVAIVVGILPAAIVAALW